ncbi:Phosphatidylinositol 4,5-bisphosphate 3-kinase catalytic subunit gamma isoform [Dirofilaria immitis]
MNDDLLDNYNPLYDVHLRQYFAMPHMQRHLRNIGLLDDDRETNKQHHATIDKMLRNREAELQKYADLQRKLHAAEKIETCRRIRSGTASPSDYHRAKASRSLSRGRYIKRSRRRQSSVSSDDKDLVQKIEAENEEPMYENPSLVYNRLSTNILKYRYLHKLDDETLALYMEQLRRQLSRLERFRQVSFGPFSVARHQNDPQVSWFFRRRSTQTLSQHRSRSSKPQLSRNTVSANSYDLQSKHQRSSETNARLPPTSRSVKSTPATNNNVIKTKRTRKLTPTETKKVPHKLTTTVLAAGEPQEVAQKIKPKNDSGITDVQATVSAVHKLVAESEIESAEHRSEESPENFDYEREASEYSGIVSPEVRDLRLRTETVSEKSASSIEHSEMPVDESDVSEQMIEESKIEQLENENKQNLNLPFDLSSEKSEKAELEAVNMMGISEAPLISKLTEPKTIESHMSRDTTIDSIRNETDSLEVVLSEEIDEDDGNLAKSWMKTDNKSEELLTGENATSYEGVMQNDHQKNHRDELAKTFEKLSTEELKFEENKMTVGKFERTDSSPTMNLETEKLMLPDDKLPEIIDTEITVKEVEKASEDNITSLQIETTNGIEITPKTTDWDVNEFAAINGKIPEIPPAEKLKIEDSIMTSEIYSIDQNKEEKNVVEAVEDINPVAKDSESLAVSPEKISSVEKLENAESCTKIEFSNGEQEISNHFMESAKVNSEADQDVEKHIIEGLPKSPRQSATETTKDESPEVPQTEIFNSTEQLGTSIENEHEASIAEYLNGKIETVNGTREIQELESAEDGFHIENFPDYSVNEQLKYQEKDIAMENNVIEENFPQAKAKQLDADVNGLEVNEELQTKQKSESLLDVSMNDESLTENYFSKADEEIIENAEFERKKKEMPEVWLEEQIPDRKMESAIEIADEEVQEVKNILQTQLEAASVSAGNDSFSEQFSQCMKSSKFDDKLNEKNEMTVLETDEMIKKEREKLSEIMLTKPENVVIMGMTNNLESVISGIQDTQPLISAPLETTKQESDGQVNDFISDTVDTMASNYNHLSEKEYPVEEKDNLILDKSIDELNSAKIDPESYEDIEDTAASSILRSDMISAESNPEVAAESNPEVAFEKEPEDHAPIISGRNLEEVEMGKQAIEENEMLEANYAREQQLSESLLRENMEKVDIAENSKCDEGIPKILVCSNGTVTDMKKLSPQSDTKTTELREQFQIEDNVETLDQQKLPPKETKSIEESETSKNEEAITSIGSDNASEGINDGKQSIKGQLNEFLQQYMHDMIQDVAQIAEERIKTSEISEKEKKIEKIDESQHLSPTPEYIPRFPANFSEIDSPKSEFDKNLQESQCNVPPSMLTAKSNNSDGNTEVTELSDTSRELMNVSHSYLTDITGEFQEGNDHFVPTRRRSSVEYDSSLQKVRSYAATEFFEDIQHIGQLERYPQELGLEKEKLEVKIAQSINGSSANNMLSKYDLIINGITADGQLILCSVSDSMISSEDKFTNYFVSNNDDSATTNEKIPSISDTNGNPELNVYDMQHIPSDVLSESNICAADVNANISSLQQINHMNSIKYEDERDQNNTLIDEHNTLLEQSNTGGTTERDVINVNREHSVS